jgi:hypothetical protein
MLLPVQLILVRIKFNLHTRSTAVTYMMQGLCVRGGKSLRRYCGFLGESVVIPMPSVGGVRGDAAVNDL